MKSINRIFALCLCLMMVFCSVPAAMAAEVNDATIHMDKPCSLTIWKYDWTNALKDGVWNEDSFISTGWSESYVEEVLGNAIRKGDSNETKDNALGNGQNSNGYALKGVQFSYLKVAEIVAFTEPANEEHPDVNMTRVLYGFDKVKSADLLTAIGLSEGAERYSAADDSELLKHENYYYTSDTLNHALSTALTSNSTTVKDSLENYMNSNGGTVMEKTNENGKTAVEDLPVGLYLLVETAVPEMVVSTTNPFFVSLPMTSVSGNEHSNSPEGGLQWNYDVVVYPKQETGIPTLEKTVREAKTDTGKNGATATITDGFAHNATGSSGDSMEYQIISSLPTITSKATSLSCYNFYDTLCNGLTYDKSESSVKIEFFSDKDCQQKVATWNQADGKFTVEYSEDNRHMTVNFTESGLAEINGDTENTNGALYKGYSNYTARVTYTASINADNSFIYGQNGNDNEVILTWKRTSSDYYDTLVDDCHVYSFGIDISKVFSETDTEAAQKAGLYEHVKFKIFNKTDGYWVTASLNKEEGAYYVTGHSAEEKNATVFTPVIFNGKPGQVMLKGCEDDEYIITETATANGFTLLKEGIHVKITASDDSSRKCAVYAKDLLGVLQNDPHYAFDGGHDLKLANIPQKALSHNYMTATATVGTHKVKMLEDNNSANAEATLTIVNTKGFDLPRTGDRGVWMYSVVGIMMMAGAVSAVFLISKKKNQGTH